MLPKNALAQRFLGNLSRTTSEFWAGGALGICFFGKNQTGIVASSNVGLYESAMLKSPSVHNLASDPGRRQYFRSEDLGLFGASSRSLTDDGLLLLMQLSTRPFQ